MDSWERSFGLNMSKYCQHDLIFLFFSIFSGWNNFVKEWLIIFSVFVAINVASTNKVHFLFHLLEVQHVKPLKEKFHF